MRIAEVALVGWAIMDLCLIQWVSYFVRKDTSGEARNKLFGVCKAGGVQNIIVNMDVIAEERQLMDRQEILAASQKGYFNPPYISYSCTTRRLPDKGAQ
jgi:hypothetical protein